MNALPANSSSGIIVVGNIRSLVFPFLTCVLHFSILEKSGKIKSIQLNSLRFFVLNNNFFHDFDILLILYNCVVFVYF